MKSYLAYRGRHWLKTYTVTLDSGVRSGKRRCVKSAIERDGSFREKAGQGTKEFWSGTVYIANDL